MSSSWQPHGLDFLWPPRTIAHQVTLSLGFPKKKHWSGLLFPSRGGFPDPKVEPGSPVLQVDSLPLRSPSRLCLKQGIPLISPLSYVPSSSQSPPPTHTYTHTCTHTCTQTHTCTHTRTRARTHTHIGCGHLYILLLPFGKPYTCFLPWKILMFPLELKWNDQSHPFETFSVQYAGLLPCVFIAPCPSPCLSPYLPAVVLNWKLLKDMTL